MSGRPVNAGPAGGPRSRPATSVDVARLAGVSRATVSHVLNDQVERFSAETVERVRSAAAALGYVRSAAGRALVMGRSDFIVLVVPHATVGRLQDLIDVLSADIEELGFTVVVHFAVARAPGVRSGRLRHMIETLRPAGIVDLGGLSEDDLAFVQEGGCPLVPPEPRPDYNSPIGRVQARHLHSRGYTRIAFAFLSDRREDVYGGGRAREAAEYCAAEGLQPPTFVHVPIKPDGARLVLERLVEERGRPVGICCYNDEVALALMFAAKALGLDVPGDVGLVGVDRTRLGQAVSPRLTSVGGDVAAAVRHFRHSLAAAYGGSPPDGPAYPVEPFQIVPGETT